MAAEPTLRISLFTFLVPFIFLFNSDLAVWQGYQTWITFFFSLSGIVFTIMGIIGYNFGSRLSLIVCISD